jgi:general secretion pathway protein N
VKRRGAGTGVAPFGWIVAGCVAGLLAVLWVVAAQAPAAWVDLALLRLTEGRVRLADATGTVWAGRGRLVLADVEGRDRRSDGVRAAAASSATVPGVVLPGAFRWQLSPWPLLVGMLDARIEHDSMGRPALVTGRADELRISPGTLTLPPVDLDRLGSPWNTIRPAGTLTVSWENVTLRSGRFDGRASIELAEAASALTPVRPLGTYRIEVVGSGAQARVGMTTLSGPLKLQGQGTWDVRGGLRFTAEARADASEQDRLQTLLGLLGVRDGERTIIRIGA